MLLKLDKFPTVLNAVRFYHADVQVVRRRFVSFAKNKPTFSYFDLRKIACQSIDLHQSAATLEATIRCGVKRADVRNRYLEVLPLLLQYIDQQKPNFIQSLGHSFTYPAGRGLIVPIDPPFVIGTSAGIVVPYMSFWKVNPLKADQMSLLCTLVRDVLEREPDYEEATLQFVDMSVPSGCASRSLRVTNLVDVPRLQPTEVAGMLDVLREGMTLAARDLATETSARPSAPMLGRDGDPNQLDLL